MDDQFARLWHDLIGRVSGPLSFRLVLQPAVAAILAIRAGMQDAKNGRPPYFWRIATHPEDRARLLGQGWHAVIKVFIAAIVIDVIYQIIAIGWVYPGEALIVAFLLACVPYPLIRGVVNRLLRSRYSARRSDLT